MRILFFGNSFTYFHDLPGMAGKLIPCHTDSVTRGGAYLHQFLDTADELNEKMEAALQNGPWDYVVLQEQSFNAVGDQADFLKSVKDLCEKIRAIGAQPVLYCSWAYKEGGPFLRESGLTYQQMMEGLLSSYTLAARENQALLAPVGPAFAALQGEFDLYDPDTLHPSVYGSYLAAGILCQVMNGKKKLTDWHPEEIAPEVAAILREKEL